MTFMRQTVKETVSFEGMGLHSGEPVQVHVHPFESGIWFRCRTERIEARPENVTDTRRCTQLGSISVVEHLMSAFAGLEITDAEVELSAPQLPGLDGSSLAYCQALQANLVAIAESNIKGPFSRIYEVLDDTKIAIATGVGLWRYDFDTGEQWPGLQSFEIDLRSSSYIEEIAPARTFAFAKELPYLEQLGLGQGLDYTTALVLAEDGYENEANFPDEPARHKLLDLIGDLYLSRIPIRMLSVVAEKSGHKANVAAAQKLAAAVQTGSH